MDAQGFVYLTGRAWDTYISGGCNVEACVVGVPGLKWE
jgi:hypothetical protein